MLATIYAPALMGIEGQLVSIECDITNGLPGLVIVGLGDKAVDEARERIRSAIKNSGFSLPAKRITLNLAPADLPKDGSGYDLGMAIAILCASNQLQQSLVDNTLFLGELALNGTVKPTRGALIAAQLASTYNFSRLIVPMASGPESSLLHDIKVFGVDSLLQTFKHLTGQQVLSCASSTPSSTANLAAPNAPDLSEIYGQHQAKRAIEIATAGGHNILLSGPPGTGKTLLAKSVLSLLPIPDLQEAIEIQKIYSLVAAVDPPPTGQRPFRAPHHSASAVAMIGGGSRPRPGEISLSHAGVLLLDEIPEFPRSVLEVLRQPLEEGSITVARASNRLSFPARFMLVATANPCPCGFARDGTGRCNCSGGSISRYIRKLSGPLLDRIDICIEVLGIDHQAIIRNESGESSSVVRERVSSARQIQHSRFSNGTIKLNSQMRNSDIKIHCKISNEIQRMAELAMQNLGLSARGYMRSLKVARTIADLAESPEIKLEHFSEALQYRSRSYTEKTKKITKIRR